MLKSILVIALVLLMGFSCMNPPLEINNLLYIPVEQSIGYSFLPVQTEIINPQLISFSITSTGTNISFKNTPGQNLRVEAFKDGEPLENLNYLELETGSPDEDILITRDNSLILQIDISQKTTGLPDGDYLYRFYSQHSDLKEIAPLELMVNYKSDPRYVKSLNYQPKDSMGMILYFPERDNKYLIPVTRFVPDNAAVLTQTIENLSKGPDPATTLNTGAIIPEVDKVYYSGSTVYVETGSLSDRLQDTDELQLALNSIVRTMTEVPGMRRVQFLPDGKRADEIAPGIPVRSPWLPDTGPAAYLPYNTFDRYLLFPYSPDLSDAVTIREYCLLLFDRLKKGLPEDPLVEPVIPKEVALLNVYYANHSLKLDFNAAFLDAYNEDRQRQSMMMDAVLYTFSSIEGVTSLQILIDGDDRHTFADHNLATSFTRPLYINPEKN